MQLSSKKMVIELLQQLKPLTILDAPCGDGWLHEMLPYAATLDGIDLYAAPVGGYRKVVRGDLSAGISSDLPKYEAVLCCEGLEHFGNPLLFLQSAMARLVPKGLLVITTPNTWYPAARLQFYLRGFFPSFPCIAGKIRQGSHMHIMPWSFPQLYLYLKLSGYEDIKLHEEPLSKPGHCWERLLALPQKVYCQRRLKKCGSEEEKDFWRLTSTDCSIFGRHIIMTARAS
jgi:SAM-dependent methyltransferase